MIEKVKNDLENLKMRYEAEEQEILNRLQKEDRNKLGFPIKDVHYLDSFNANGVKYVVRTSLCITRFEEFGNLQIDVGYGVSMDVMFSNMRKAYDYLNLSQPADAAIVLFNSMNGIKDKLEGREHEVLKLCALFICREGEDITKYDTVLEKEKIQDWRDEGISMESFFSFAFNLVPGFTPLLNQVSEDTSTLKKPTIQARKKKKL